MPIHSELVKMGFMDYVKEMREKKSVRLFPELKKEKKVAGILMGLVRRSGIYYRLLISSFRMKMINLLEVSIVSIHLGTILEIVFVKMSVTKKL